MDLRLNLDEDEQMLFDTAREFVEERSPVDRVRQLRDQRDPVGFSRALWAEMAEMGWLGLTVSEDHGGSELGFFAQAMLLRAAGRQLMAEPFSSLVMATPMVQADATLVQSTLPSMCAGQTIVTLAWQEDKSRYDARKISTGARREADGWWVTGQKVHVIDGHVADVIIVSALEPDTHIGLFAIRPGPGVTITRQTRVDGRNAAIIDLAGALGERLNTDGGALLDAVITRSTVALCAEMLGMAEAAFEATIEYLKTRHQFGVPIGSFQALQHRAARLFLELSLARSAVLAACRAVDEAPGLLPELASAAKARMGESLLNICNEGVQMHGGVGVTDEYDIGLFLKRARACDATFGDVSFHRDRWARLKGY